MKPTFTDLHILSNFLAPPSDRCYSYILRHDIKNYKNWVAKLEVPASVKRDLLVREGAVQPSLNNFWEIFNPSTLAACAEGGFAPLRLLEREGEGWILGTGKLIAGSAVKIDCVIRQDFAALSISELIFSGIRISGPTLAAVRDRRVREGLAAVARKLQEKINSQFCELQAEMATY